MQALTALIDQPPADEPADQHRAGAAIALGAAFLGAAQRRSSRSQSSRVASGATVDERDILAIEDKADLVADAALAMPQLPR